MNLPNIRMTVRAESEEARQKGVRVAARLNALLNAPPGALSFVCADTGEVRQALQGVAGLTIPPRPGPSPQ